MTAMKATEGDLALLDEPVARRLLASAIPARLGYIAPDGTPRVTPMWFAFIEDTREFVLGASGTSPKVEAIQRNPKVALTVDDSSPPYKSLLVRGEATVELLEGAVPEYANAALRYFGEEAGKRFRDQAMEDYLGMARITVKPLWVGLIDFETRFPRDYGSG